MEGRLPGGDAVTATRYGLNVLTPRSSASTQGVEGPFVRYLTLIGS